MYLEEKFRSHISNLQVPVKSRNPSGRINYKRFPFLQDYYPITLVAIIVKRHRETLRYQAEGIITNTFNFKYKKISGQWYVPTYQLMRFIDEQF